MPNRPAIPQACTTHQPGRRIVGPSGYGCWPRCTALLVIAPLVAIFAYLVYQGASALSWEFLTHAPKPVEKRAEEWETRLSARG